MTFSSNIIKNSSLAFSILWSSVQSKLPKKTFKFSLSYIAIHCLVERIKLNGVCHYLPIDHSVSETLLHVISGCKTFLDEGKFMLRQNAVLSFIASSLLNVERSKLCVDLPGLIS